MSTRINLLPWREELKKERQKQFYVILGVAAALGVGVWLGGRTHLSGQIDYHDLRNNMLRTEIRSLDRQITRIRELEAVRDQLNARMEVIKDLQSERPQIVHMFEQMVLTLPEGLYLQSLSQEGPNLTLTGVGQSNARVSSYMERLDGSDWLQDPDLTVIEVRQQDGIRVSDFTLRVIQSAPGNDTEDGEDAG
ncbi:MAG: PilN domain-containing protein [Aquisalimonadaceae bacterium]